MATAANHHVARGAHHHAASIKYANQYRCHQFNRSAWGEAGSHVNISMSSNQRNNAAAPCKYGERRASPDAEKPRGDDIDNKLCMRIPGIGSDCNVVVHISNVSRRGYDNNEASVREK